MHYLGTDVQCVGGYPICRLDSKTCNVSSCRYFIKVETLGNCTLRVDKHDHFRMQVIATAMGVTRQRVDQFEKRGLRKLKKWHERILREMREHFFDTSIKDVPLYRKDRKFSNHPFIYGDNDRFGR